MAGFTLLPTQGEGIRAWADSPDIQTLFAWHVNRPSTRVEVLPHDDSPGSESAPTSPPPPPPWAPKGWCFYYRCRRRGMVGLSPRKPTGKGPKEGVNISPMAHPQVRIADRIPTKSAQTAAVVATTFPAFPPKETDACQVSQRVALANPLITSPLTSARPNHNKPFPTKCIPKTIGPCEIG